MEELNKEDLRLFFDEEIYLIKDKDNAESASISNIEKPIKVESSAPSTVEEPLIEAISLVYKGGNDKGIAIIINDDSNEFLNTTDEALLLNILKATGFSLEDVAIINQHNSGVGWQSQLDFSKVIVFGILPSTYGIASENYSIQKHEEADWLFSDSLFSLGSDKVLKGKLWGELQELFK
ncbi:MAG: hypothetical protein L3J29_05940 [Cyclobacteriaceae bacterium]|nr:hypothetical protein [Cyclobacteriaceae bacterium]